MLYDLRNHAFGNPSSGYIICETNRRAGSFFTGNGTFLTPSGGVVTIEEYGVAHRWTQEQIYHAAAKGVFKKIEQTVLMIISDLEGKLG